MTTHTVETATAADAAAVLAVLTLAFGDDPMARWSWPKGPLHLATFAPFAKAFGGAAFAHGSAHRIGGVGASLWLPPDVHPNETELGRIIERTMPERLKADVARIMEQMAK